MRKLAAQYGISPAVTRTWLFEAGITPVGAPGRPRLDIDVVKLTERRARGDPWTMIAHDPEGLGGHAPASAERRIPRRPLGSVCRRT
jgi:hypothetical protein